MYDFTFPENTTVNEDCLYLNVWTPSTVGKRPVMFWIHGGSLLNGGNSEYRLAGARMAQGNKMNRKQKKKTEHKERKEFRKFFSQELFLTCFF